MTAPRIPPCTESVDAIPRRGPSFEWHHQTIHEFGLNQLGAQLVVARNPLRIRAVLYAPASNAGLIYIGSSAAIPQLLLAVSISNVVEMEPGTGWEIDDTIAAIHAFARAGDGDQFLRWYEAATDPRIPLLVGL